MQLKFLGSPITTDARLLVYRELDEEVVYATETMDGRHGDAGRVVAGGGCSGQCGQGG